MHGVYGTYGERRGTYRVLVGKLEETKPLGRPGRRWEDNIQIAIMKISLEGVDWILLAQDRDRSRLL
jgi:hypothetical protein